MARSDHVTSEDDKPAGFQSISSNEKLSSIGLDDADCNGCSNAKDDVFQNWWIPHGPKSTNYVFQHWWRYNGRTCTKEDEAFCMRIWGKESGEAIRRNRHKYDDYYFAEYNYTHFRWAHDLKVYHYDEFHEIYGDHHLVAWDAAPHVMSCGGAFQVPYWLLAIQHPMPLSSLD